MNASISEETYERLRALPDAFDIIDALIRFQLYGEEPVGLSEPARAIFEAEISDRRKITSRANGKKGGRPKGAKNKNKVPNLTEVEAFIKRNDLRVNARDFFDYYERRNWRTGDDKVENWKGLLKQWEKNQEEQRQRLMRALKA